MKKSQILLALFSLISIIVIMVILLQTKTNVEQSTAATLEPKLHIDQSKAAPVQSEAHDDQSTATVQSTTHDDQSTATVQSTTHDDQSTATVQSTTHDDQSTATVQSTTHDDQSTATVQSTTHDDQSTATVQSTTHDDQSTATVQSTAHDDQPTAATVESKAAPKNRGLHFVTYHHSITLAQNAANSKINDRVKEEMYVLRKNLQHPLVTNMHIIAANKTTYKKALKKEEADDKKVIIYDNGRPPTMKEVFQYVSDHLINKIVIVSNGDIYLGSGFDRLNRTAMTEKRIMYALTRHHAPESNCTEGGALCNVPYLGSHDTFVFILNEPIPSDVLDELDYQLGSPGSENRLMWVFKTKLKYCLRNPCSVLKSYHFHCSGVRTSHQRMNTNGKSTICPPSENLTCS